ncbi:hypothetical protein WN48_08559 [Eufriesea mexicana]|uniref:Uncharacterized protein n=1 Tax=Eufriesea mexicana TaxID=516756 RepID=A0A310SIL2_9HYME|nr:hypothetical protein WN48_08559 [Eufriesea mexicana]
MEIPIHQDTRVKSLSLFMVTLVLLLATVSITLARSQALEISDKGLDMTQPPIKLDKNLRRALLKALTDLEAESAEQHKEDTVNIAQRDTSAFEGVAKKNLNDKLDVQKTTFSFKSFPGDDDLPSEDKLQNSSFVDAVRYVTLKTPGMNIEKATQEDARSFHVQNVILPGKNPVTFGAKTEIKVEQREKTTQASVNTFPKVESVTLRPVMEVSESLAGSATNGIASANALIAPKPTEISPTAPAENNVTIIDSNDSKDKTEEVKIFEAPLVAAFTVQQDEQGVPKSVVPIFSNNLLTFQPPVDTNVHLQPSVALEVPSVAAPQTFHSSFQQEQLRIQPFRQQQQQQPQHHHQQQQQQQHQPLPQIQQSQQLHQPQQQHQQRQQQSFSSFSTDFQPSLGSTTRFNRQEAFNAVGNFGFNVDNKVTPTRGNFGFNVPQRTPANFYNPFTQFKQAKPPTPARQIQHLLYQSGIAGDLNNVPGIGNHEDLNIVSKVLALNVGAVPNKNLQFATNPAATKTSA